MQFCVAEAYQHERWVGNSTELYTGGDEELLKYFTQGKGHDRIYFRKISEAGQMRDRKDMRPEAERPITKNHTNQEESETKCSGGARFKIHLGGKKQQDNRLNDQVD